jgi:hypothetical protein
MTAHFPPMYRLTPRGGVGLACDEHGIVLGPVVLVEAVAVGSRAQFRPRPAEEVARTFALAYGNLAPDITRCLASLDVAAKALETGDLAKASVATVLLKLPDLSVDGFAKLAADPSLKKYSPDQPRDDHGRWTSDGGESGDAGVQVADAREGISDASGYLPMQNAANDALGTTPARVIPPPPPGTGNVREYSPEAAAKLPPPPSGSKYVTLNDGSVAWSQYSNGPMLMPEDASLEENTRVGERLAEFGQLSPSVEDSALPPRESVMALLFLPGHGRMDYQSAYGAAGAYNRDYVDFTSYNYGAVAAAAGYSRDEALVNAGYANVIADWWDQNVHGDPPKDRSGPYQNKGRNAEMIIKGFEDHKAGRIGPTGK